MQILAGDIGGTKTRLALIEAVEQELRIVGEQSYPSREYPALEAIVAEFLATSMQTPDLAGFGLAGPVHGRRCRITNLPWLVDAARMEAALGIRRVVLLNDLEATAWGIGALAEEEFHLLQAGHTDRRGNRSVIAAGTGLGEAGLFWDGAVHRPFATEGGHSDFAPQSELECELLRHLQGGRQHRISWEQLVSGPGLVNIYRFLSARKRARMVPEMERAMQAGDAAAVIARLGSDGSDPVCTDAMALFARLYGAEAGNLALKHMATGGLYIGGGIAPKILPWLDGPEFLQAFCAKGKMERLLQSIPVRVILNDRAALYGPAVYLRPEA